MKSRKVTNASGVKNALPSKPLGNDKSPKIKSVPPPVGTYRKDHSLKTEASGNWAAIKQEIGVVAGFFGRHIGAYFYSYYEAGVAIKDVVSDCGKSLGRQVLFLIGLKTSSRISSGKIEVKQKKEKNRTTTTINPGTGSLTFKPNSSSQVSTKKVKPKSEKKLVQINLAETEDLLLAGAAMLVVERCTDFTDADRKIILMLGDIADGQSFEIAARYFASSHRLRRAFETRTTVVNNAKAALHDFIIRKTANPEVAERIVALISTPVPQAENSETDELSSLAVIDINDAVEPVPVQANSVEFTPVSSNAQNDTSNQRREVGDFLLDAEVRSMLGGSLNFSLHSHSANGDIARFLANKQNDALVAAKAFIRNLARLDESGADGVVKFFRKAVERERSDPRYIFGYYIKAEAAVSLLEQFKRRSIGADSVKMTFLLDGAEDIKLETESCVYLIKIKSSFERAIAGIREIKTLAYHANALNAFLRIGLLELGESKRTIPVCVINAAGNKIVDLENRVIDELSDRRFCDGVRDLLDIEIEVPGFQLWDINGVNIGPKLSQISGRNSRIFNVA